MRKTGGGRVSAAAPFGKLTTAPAWTGEACATGRWPPRPAGLVEQVNAMAAKEELERLRLCVYYVMNRGNCRVDIFRKPGDFAAFVTILEEGR